MPPDMIQKILENNKNIEEILKKISKKLEEHEQEINLLKSKI